MLATILPILAQLALKGADVYTQMHAASSSGNLEKALTLIPIATRIYTSTRQIGDVLQTAQAEGWKDDDARWVPVFKAADEALAAAEGRLVPPG